MVKNRWFFFFSWPFFNNCKTGADLLPSPKTNSQFAPEKGWFGDDPFISGFGLFSGALVVSFRQGNFLGGGGCRVESVS